MKYKLYNLIILVVSIFIISPVLSQNELLKREIISRVIDSIDAHNQLEFEMYRSERNENNEFIEGKFYAKLINSPYKIYIKNEKPRKGAEVLDDYVAINKSYSSPISALTGQITDTS